MTTVSFSEIKVQFGKAMGDLGTEDTTIATYSASDASWEVTALENDGSINATTGWHLQYIRQVTRILLMLELLQQIKFHLIKMQAQRFHTPRKIMVTLFTGFCISTQQRLIV